MKKGILVLIAGMILLLESFMVYADPLGSSIDIGPSTRKVNPTATNVTSQSGNVTYIVADITQITNVWQGFYGVVSGGIVLEDAGNNKFYDWNVVDAVGEVLATREMISDWSLINCSNQTEIYEEEERLDILNESSDGINDTFTNTSHPQFDIAGKFLSNCRATRTYNSTTRDSVFWNVLLNANASNTVYTVLMENDVIGFNGTRVDFQILVPVDRLTGHSEYFIYVELS